MDKDWCEIKNVLTKKFEKKINCEGCLLGVDPFVDRKYGIVLSANIGDPEKVKQAKCRITVEVLKSALGEETNKEKLIEDLSEITGLNKETVETIIESN